MDICEQYLSLKSYFEMAAHKETEESCNEPHQVLLDNITVGIMLNG